MKRVESIEIEFSNCEHAVIPIEYILAFHIGKIRTEITKAAINTVLREDIAEEVFLEIFSEIDDIGYHPFGDKSVKKSILRRIEMCGDITGINVNYINGDEENYLVPYITDNSEGEGPNRLQKVYLSDLGNLYLLIGKDMNLEDYVEMERINDPVQMKGWKEIQFRQLKKKTKPDNAKSGS